MIVGCDIDDNLDVSDDHAYLILCLCIRQDARQSD